MTLENFTSIYSMLNFPLIEVLCTSAGAGSLPLVETLCVSARAGGLPKKDCSDEHGKVEQYAYDNHKRKPPEKEAA